MLWLPIRRRNGRVGRWFLVGMHREERKGLHQFLALAGEFRSRDTVIVLARSVLNRATGRFHDRILRAGGSAPMIDRREMEWLGPAARSDLARRLQRRERIMPDGPPPDLPAPVMVSPRPRPRLLAPMAVVIGIAVAVALSALPR